MGQLNYTKPGLKIAQSMVGQHDVVRLYRGRGCCPAETVSTCTHKCIVNTCMYGQPFMVNCAWSTTQNPNHTAWTFQSTLLVAQTKWQQLQNVQYPTVISRFDSWLKEPSVWILNCMANVYRRLLLQEMAAASQRGLIWSGVCKLFLL